MREVTLRGKPYSRIGTPAHTGPYSRLRGDYMRWLEQGRQAWEMVLFGPYSVRQAAAVLGMSPTTVWRRAWWYEDWIALPRYYGHEPGPVPHQRGTRAVPRGRPITLSLDGPDVLRQLRGAGYSLTDIIGSHRTVPKELRDLATAELDKLRELAELLDFLEDEHRQELVTRYPSLYRDLLHLAAATS